MSVNPTAPWRKGIAEWIRGDTAFLSVVFTWDVDAAIERARFWGACGYKVRVGGPGVFLLAKEFDGIAKVGGAIKDAVTRHNPDATFASRGCPVGCSFCVVPPMEGRDFTMIPDFTPRPILCDNNLSALEPAYQDHIIDRYEAAGVPLLDANSGFEPATFTEEVYRRWKPILRGPWRFAFDETKEREDVRRVMAMLGDVSARKKRVYVLIGNEPFDACMARVREVIDWGGEPHVQPVMKLKAREKRPWAKLDWTEQLLRKVARWTNRRYWKYVEFKDYNANARPSPDTGQRTLEFVG